MGTHSFNRKLLWAYYVPGTVLGMWDTVVGEAELCPPGADILVGNGCIGGHRRPCWSGSSAVQGWGTRPSRSKAVLL